MKKILFLPLLDSMPSGHHEAAEAVMEYASAYGENVICQKVDLLSEWNAMIETQAVKLYKSWIRQAPQVYGMIYRKSAQGSETPRSHKLYELMFSRILKQIVEREQPDLIVCTHALPSYLINYLKEKGECEVPCINVYTDFFINDIWGISQIDMHFVPVPLLKRQLMEAGISKKRIFVTGIPVSLKIESGQQQPRSESSNLLIFGAGMKGERLMEDVQQAETAGEWRFQVVNGKKQKYAAQVQAGHFPNLHLLPDIASKEKMNALYNRSCALITKPGGILVSEALTKNLPIFVHDTLPGQEQVNLRFLQEQGVVFRIPKHANMIEFVQQTLEDEQKMSRYDENLREFNGQKELRNPIEVWAVMEGVLEHSRR